MSTKTKEWAKTREAEELLCLSERTLLRLRKDRTLVPGLCWRRTIPHNLNLNVVYNIPECLRVLNGITRASEMEMDMLANLKKKEISL